MAFYHAIYGKSGGDTPAINNPTVNSYDNTENNAIETLTFVVNVGQMAILSAGSGDTTVSIPFNSGASADTQGWTISNTSSILGSIRGSSNVTSSNDNTALGCLIVMPNTETGTVSVSRRGGGDSWVGVSYIILDL